MSTWNNKQNRQVQLALQVLKRAKILRALKDLSMLCYHHDDGLFLATDGRKEQGSIIAWFYIQNTEVTRIVAFHLSLVISTRRVQRVSVALDALSVGARLSAAHGKPQGKWSYERSVRRWMA